jgi:hypothetical protein
MKKLFFVLLLACVSFAIGLALGYITHPWIMP